MTATHRIVIAVLFVALVIVGTNRAGASATASPAKASRGWTAASGPLPTNGTGAQLTSEACPGTHDCTAVGVYYTHVGSVALVDTLSAGTWTATAAPEPANASTATDGVILWSISCPAPGSCVAVGYYEDTGAYTYGLIDTLSAGTWTATEAPEPANAGTDADKHQHLSLSAVSCPSANSCTAVGDYYDTNGTQYGLIETFSGGSWTAIAGPGPNNLGINFGGDEVSSLTTISCPAAGSCSAVGDYFDTNHYDYGLIEILSAGTWTATQAPEPANAGTDANETQDAYLDSVSCPVVGNCIALGTYDDANHYGDGLIESLSGGAWIATQAPEPANSGTDADTYQAGYLESVSCPSAESCIGVGTYSDTSGGLHGLIETLSGGTWTATEAREPANAGTDADGHQFATLTSVSCAAVESCTAVGSFADKRNFVYGLIETLGTRIGPQSGRPSQPTPAPTPTVSNMPDSFLSPVPRLALASRLVRTSQLLGGTEG